MLKYNLARKYISIVFIKFKIDVSSVQSLQLKSKVVT